MANRDPLTEDNLQEALAAFNDCGWKEAIKDVADRGVLEIISPMSASASRADDEGRRIHGKVLRLLAEACDMMLSPSSHNEPFRPTLVSGPYRSILPEDLSVSEIEFFAQIIDSIDNPFLKGRLSDIVFFRQKRREAKFALAAIDSYRSIPLDSTTWSVGAEQCWERAITLTRMLGRGAGKRLSEIESAIVDAVKATTHEDGFLLRSLSELLKATNLGSNDSGLIAEKLESVAVEFEQLCDFDLSRAYYNDSAIWFQRSGDIGKSIALTVAEAEALVSLANFRISSAPPSYGVAASFLQSAIQVYRKIPRAERPSHNVDQRIKELGDELNDANQRAMNEMATVSVSSGDVSDIVELARQSVSGLAPGDALGTFTDLYHARFQKIRETAVRYATNSIRAMMPTVVKSEDGRVVASHPGLSGPIPSDEDEAVIRAEMARHYVSETRLAVIGLIVPALDTLHLEHRLREADFVEVARLSPVVPPEREMLIGKALFQGYDGDFVASLHILSPQIEHIVRFQLKQSGVDTTHLDPKDIQHERGLSSLVESPEVARIFGEDAAYEIKTLFCDPFAYNLRNDVAHGLVDDRRSQSVESVYAWWFGMKLVYKYLPRKTEQNTTTHPDENQVNATMNETEMTVLESLKAAEREFSAGNNRESSRILWQATRATFNMLAAAYGLDSSNHIAVAKALDEKEKRKYYYRGYLLAGRLLRDHAEMNALEYYELEEPHQSLPLFIRRCHQEVNPNGSGR